MKNKVLVIGLDGATFDLLRPWIKEDKLPNIAEVMKKGTYGQLESVTPPNSPPAWASFMTGKNPGKHSVYGFLTPKPNTYGEFRPINSKDIRSETLWGILSKAGKKVGVMGVPFTYPPEEVNGFLISGWDTPSSAGNYVFPLKLRKELENYQLAPSDKVLHNLHACSYEEVLDQVSMFTENQVSHALKLMDSIDWDFFMIVFVGTDIIQHRFWHLVDPKHPRYDPQEAKKYGNGILNYYQKIDKMIGEILKKTPKNTVCIVMSDHGCAPTSTKSLSINNWLQRMELLKTRRSLMLIRKILERISSFLSSYGLGVQKVRGGGKIIDWSNTKAWFGGIGIRINLKGKYPKGKVEGKEYEEIRDTIIARLERWADSKTNRRVIRKVLKREEVYWGKHLEIAPDLVVIAEEDYYLHTGLRDELIFETPLVYDRHRPNGIFIVSGPNIKRGIEIEGLKIIDVAPTILHIMNVALPSDMDGKVVTEIFKPRSKVAKRSVRYRRPFEERVEYYWKKEEEEEIKKRLKGLGYLN